MHLNLSNQNISSIKLLQHPPPIIFKYILSIISFGTMTYFIIACFRQYFSYPTQTRVYISLNRFQNFPALTMCSGNPVRFDKYYRPLIAYILANNLTTSSNITPNDIYYGAFNYMTYLFNENKTDQMQSYGFQLEDILLDCSYNGYNCQHMWTKSISPILGNCYTFNQQTADKKKNLFRINDVNGQNQAYHNGLIITFYLNIEHYFPINEYGLGLTGILHNSDEQPLIRYSGKRFSPGFEHKLVYEKITSTYLGSPYTPCTTEIRDDMQALYTLFDNNTDYVYSETVCLELCHQTYIYEQCGCTFPAYFYFNHLIINDRLQWIRTCTPWTSEYRCTINSRQRISDDENLQKYRCRHCQSQCIIHRYSNDLSSLKGPSDSQKKYYTNLILANPLIPIQSDFRTNTSYYLDRNYLKLTIIPLNAYTTIYEEKATYLWSALISDLGGQIGLWLGISVLSLFELFEYFYKRSQEIWLRKKEKTKINVQSFETKPSIINSIDSTAKFRTSNNRKSIKIKNRY